MDLLGALGSLETRRSLDGCADAMRSYYRSTRYDQTLTGWLRQRCKVLLPLSTFITPFYQPSTRHAVARNMKDEQPKESFINPIDEDKIAENPHLLPYAHTVGGAVIKPTDRGKIKGRALSAMYDQTDRQFEQLREQMETLAKQAKELQKRVEVSEQIYQAKINFEPLVGKTYYLYERDDSTHMLSLIRPDEWGRSGDKFTFTAQVTLLADHTWEVLPAEEQETTEI